MKIGQVSKQLALSIDTLRYYEKFGLLPGIKRNASGIRSYSGQDISRLNFIKRAQQMNFKLAEIKDLLRMRKNPQTAKSDIRKKSAAKLEQIDIRITELTTLRNELQLLINLCHGSSDGCPIIDEMDKNKNKL